MTKMLSVRLKRELFSAIQDRAEEMGCNRSEYLVRLVERDLEEARSRRKRRFASDDLIGSLRTGLRAGDNATVRAVITKRLREKNR